MIQVSWGAPGLYRWLYKWVNRGFLISGNKKESILTKNRENGYVGVVVLVMLAIIAVTLLTSIRIVGTGKVGVVTNFGRVTGQELGEGFHLVAPWWINNVTTYDVKTQKGELTAKAATKEQQDATANVVVTYHLEQGDVANIHQSVGKRYKSTLIDPTAQSAFKANSAKYTALELLSNRPKVEDEVKSSLEKKVSSRGIIVEDVSITDIQFSKEFTQAIEQRQVAQQNAERAKYNLEQAKLDAQAQDVQAKTLTDNYIRLKELEVTQQAIKKWNGKMPQALSNGTNILGLNLTK